MTNNMIVLALAHDFTGEQKYLDSVVSGMDYLLGRNAMDKCDVSGDGKNPHHRFWARQLDAEYPPPPPDAISGGPNSARQDPIAMEWSRCPRTAHRRSATSPGSRSRPPYTFPFPSLHRPVLSMLVELATYLEDVT